MRRLHVLLGDELVAVLTQTDGGEHRLQYAGEGAAELSVALPVREAPYTGRQVDPYLEGLLPDRTGVREALAQRFDVSPRNPFALLEHIGLDCAGAVRFATDADLPAALTDDGGLTALDDDALADRLRALEAGREPSWVAPGVGGSLAGAQTKIALRRQGGTWFEAHGSEPTTHILKPGITGMKEQALGEHLCLAAIRRAGLPAVATSYEAVGNAEVVVVERYDRAVRPGGGVVRLHQEDLCQATSTYPRRRYESAGGPGAPRLIELLGDACTDSGASVRRFVDGLIANVLLGAPDAHSKNYSILHVAGHRVLAPLYDVASGLPYTRGAASFGSSGGDAPWRTSAMSIGGERELARIGGAQWEQLARDAQLARRARMDGAAVVDRVAELSRVLPQALSDVVAAERADNPAMAGKEIPSRLLDTVAVRCEEARALL